MKRTALQHTKMKRLMQSLNCPLYVAVGIMETLWNLTSREAPSGSIGKLSNDDIALQLDWRGEPDVLVKALMVSGWLDIDEELRLIVHDWHEHADDATDNALARSGQYYATGQMPRMNRLSAKEKQELRAKFYAQKPTEAHAVRTESHKKPLPLPCPALPVEKTPPPAREAEVWQADEPPPGLPMLVYARGLMETVCIPETNATMLAVSAGIGAYGREKKLESHIATAQLTKLARDALARDERVDKFWFEDAKWRGGKANGAATGNRGRPFEPGIYTGPQPTEDEIEKIRAQVEAKKAALIAAGKIPPMSKVLQRAGDCRT